MTAIDDKYAALRGPGGFLGQPTSSEQDCPDRRGRLRHFQNGSIYWSPETGAHEVHGLIREKWAALGRERSFLRYPLTDETSTPDSVGRYNHFQGGSIYWTPQTGAHEVHGLIREKWAALGWERSTLGYPTTDEGTTEFIWASPPGQPRRRLLLPAGRAVIAIFNMSRFTGVLRQVPTWSVLESRSGTGVQKQMPGAVTVGSI